ncbi:hypothetical protein TK11N_04470 [Tetragenococcus koreensis]|uniref:Uncharacterized protein n=1 Tax=Tetragenococcus koreensis TaxID=290335 RepID=A0AAN4RJC9_9ENTE|nr:hypothetical protein TK11N_04470 [Tetragenococcus koreensis]GEQ51024.1 hypothetical protein TK12N_03680 [Tetragenococcus koreensis]GEQ53603.1 hypothetical protein TK2N_04470 [Tetragenococcus koreensis]GEQ56062.1 hypothetical protein TK4N_04050 [Tetragenococcus koreensis]GEQ58608.1 hypothetical protein TK6N_04470 [Tetragenococcus koreensis]
MRSNYDDPNFFNAYAEMDRSKYGLKGAGEWHRLKRSIPQLCWKNSPRLGLWLWLALQICG